MAEEIKTTETIPTEPVVEGKEEKSLLDGENKTEQGAVKKEEKGGGSILEDASNEEKQKVLDAEKKLLETDDAELSEEDKTKKAELVKNNADREKADKDAEKAKAVPEKYDFKMPEGVELNKELVEKVTPIFKDLGLSQENAQRLADFHVDYLKTSAESQATDFAKFVEDSKAETIKALGANYKEEMAFAAKVKERFLSKETMEHLNASGLSNNKDLILDLIKIGRVISEDKMEDGKKGAEGQSPGDIFYNKKK